MQIAFSEVLDQPKNISALRQNLFTLFNKRIWLQSSLALISVILLCMMLIASIAQISSMNLGLLTSTFFFSLVGWYVVHIWYESEWPETINQTISSYIPKNASAEKRANFLFEEAQMLKLPQNRAFSLPFLLKWLNPCLQAVEKTVNFFFWKKKLDILEALQISAARARIEMIENTPLDPKAHAELANCYVALSQLFQEASFHRNRYGLYVQLPLPKHTQEVETKHRQYAKLAVQELTIVSQFAQDAVWVLEQLALSYKELNMPSDELTAWQKVLSIDPDDIQALVRSGLLAFELKLPKTGLEAYARLKDLSPMQAEEVLSAYKECLN